MKITLADHYGMCFGVRDALRKTHEVASNEPVTVLGELVHNPVVRTQLAGMGVREGDLSTIGSSSTHRVVITAHGAADQHRAAWKEAGHAVTDTTCPLVRKAHTALAQLVAAGCLPVVIGQKNHVEVRGLVGDFPGAWVVLTVDELESLPECEKYGVVSQTTQPLAHVKQVVSALRARFPAAQVEFRDTVCQPTKDRQAALEKLCREQEVIIAVGGSNSNNTRQLVLTAERFGCKSHQVETAADLDPQWFKGVQRVGVTAGTSTLDETVRDVVETLKAMSREGESSLRQTMLAMAVKSIV